MTSAAFTPHAPTLQDVIAAQVALRAQCPLVQCLTNSVSTNFMANALLAVGASPAMVDNPEEAGLFARVANAVLINLGTPTQAQVEAMRLAAAAAQEAGKPWVLDPIGAGGLPWRGGVALELLAHHPAMIRGNASEILGLAGLGKGARGVDSTADPSAAMDSAVKLLDYAGAVSASGAVDYVVGRVGATQTPTLVRIAGGNVLLTRVTAAGCALGALAAAYGAVASDPFTALVAAHTHFAVAAELAAERASQPGSFAVAFLDALDAVEGSTLAARGQVQAAVTLAN
ncbi:hydroxyethylthiazole kinase [Synechococcus sp. Nb3U1]|uniref:hydroxyethylthiazole kinase n=1 Tax=Synechococcus sp. Nb3U1 TaxID=1914529 RepID=UPI001F42A801|nr:hydroxyethylthiazole kinase [Synechococcus sp. Nb3U1]MCF2972269.1 hydroxyethylthiazole kinase [Synechococcus sp. Nb3U1]